MGVDAGLSKMATAGMPMPIPQQGEIVAVGVSLLHAAVDLESTVDTLRDRLHPVMSLSEPPPNGPGTPEPEMKTVMGTDLAAVCKSLNQTHLRLLELIRRLEI